MNAAAPTVRTITPDEHLEHVRAQRSASFLQTPAWGEVKSEWRRESVGWFRDQELVGSALVLYRQLPKVRRFLAYLPEGPVIDWSTDDLGAWLAPLVSHLKEAGAFGVRMGPPVVVARWSADALKQGIADDAVSRLSDVPPTERSQEGARVASQLQELGWQLQGAEGGFAAGQPRFNFQIPLRQIEGRTAGEPRTEEDVLAGMNQQWRRNIKKAAKAGVEVSTGSTTGVRSTTGDGSTTGHEPPDDLRLFHDLYVHTAARDGFTPRPLAYFETMFRALLDEEPDRIRLYLARHEGDLVAATIGIRVGTHTWYSYGASSTEKRDVRGSNAIQWRMIQDALAAEGDVYDLRGITETLDADDPHIGLIQFKVGTGGEAVEYAGEWDLPLNAVVYKAFSVYMARRSGGQ